MKKLFFLAASCIVFVQPAAHAMDALRYAARDGDTAQVTALLNSGTNVNQQNEYGDTPLHAAARNGREAVARLLLEWGANPNLADYGDRKPLDCPFVKTLYTEILQQRKHDARLAILMGSHSRTGAHSPARYISADNIRQIFASLQLEDFSAIPTAATVVMPQPATSAPILQQALSLAQNIWRRLWNH